MKVFSQKKVLLTIVSIVLFYAIFSFYSDFDKMQKIFQNVNMFYLIPLFGILSISIVIRSLIQRLLLINIGIKLSMKENFQIYLAGLSMLITPGGSGVLIKSYLIQQRHRYSIAKTMPLIFAERFYELVGIIIVITTSLLFIYSHESFTIATISAVIISTLIYLMRAEKSLKFLLRILKKIKPLGKDLADETEFYESLNNLFKIKSMLFVSLIVSFLTFFESLMFYFGFLAFNIDLGFFSSIQIFYTSVLFGSLFLIPGGIGATEGLFVSLLAQRNIEFTLASSLIMFLRLSTIWLMTGIGFIASYAILLRNRN